jgi:transcriptional regulator with XRE-family HTH domain
MNRTQTSKAAGPKRATVRPAPSAGAPQTDKHVPNLGECLRAIRFKRRLSLADVSAATGLARSTLSRVESNQLSLTYDKLVQLSRGLQIDLAELLSSRVEGPAQPTLTRRAFTPPGAGKAVAVGSIVYRYPCTELSAKRMTPMLADVRTRSIEESNALSAHPGEEFTYVLAGRVQLHTEFYEPLVLETGACVYFDSTMRHTYVAMDGEPAQILCVCSVDDAAIQHSIAASPKPPSPASKTRSARGRAARPHARDA